MIGFGKPIGETLNQVRHGAHWCEIKMVHAFDTEANDLPVVGSCFLPQPAYNNREAAEGECVFLEPEEA